MSNNDPFNSSTDLGVKDLSTYKITKLVGQQNFAKWDRDVKVTAQYLSVWNHINGDAMITEKPEILPYLTEAFQTVKRDTKPTTTNGVNDAGQATRVNVPAMIEENDKVFYQQIMVKNAEKKYEQALDTWNQQNRKVGKALTLLRLHVADPIRSVLNNYSDPSLAYKYLVKQYKLSDYQNLQMLHKEIESLNLSQCKNLDDFFSNLEDRVIHLRELSGSYDNTALQAKIFRSLTPEYNETLRFMNLLYNRQNNTWPELDDIKRQLQDAEIEFGRKKNTTHNKNNNNSSNNNSSNNNSSNNNSSNNNSSTNTSTSGQDKKPRKEQNDDTKCPVQGCKGFNHTRNQCYIENPHLKPEWMKLKEKDQAEKKTKAAQSPDKVKSFVFNPDANSIQLALEQALEANKVNSASMAPTPDDESNKTCNSHADDLNTDQDSMFSLQSSQTSQTDNNSLKFELAKALDVEMRNTLGLVWEMRLKSVVGLALVDNKSDDMVNEWILDSGASMHLCNDRTKFVEFANLPNKTVRIANTKASLDITGGGTVLLNVETKEGKWNQIKLTNVLYSPDAMCSLLSISQMTLKGVEGYVNHDTFNLKHEGELLLDSTVYNGLYHLNMRQDQDQDQDCLLTSISNNDEGNITDENNEPSVPPHDQPPPTAPPEPQQEPDEGSEASEEPGFNFHDRVWSLHRDLGHMSLESMCKLVDMSEGIPVSKKEIKARMRQVCPVCKVTKSVMFGDHTE
ncbi:hypothetical protein HBI88_088490 [Parastagonospora nodorum]|nr:hypothetical protein HBI97_099040 [Parastagonospora nodorum]KAH5825895.1 hypothetical protein HBI93_154320 [Parastagonospora nodorum]KAH5874231.1 hypothetical protein HBI90_076290 [Parastagonospora nodorum]KAH5931078.1 hypothetical protein HBI88_088490 [Parastagonospora nodorum]KAH5942569.1 hypothetical protein HBI86_145380 [Parastagonospora nodorum]